jgi:hypothetical protein
MWLIQKNEACKSEFTDPSLNTPQATQLLVTCLLPLGN